MCIDSDVNNVAALKITTPDGVVYAVFPDNARHCELHGMTLSGLEYFESRLIHMFKAHGHRLYLSHLEPDDLMKYGNRPDLEIEVTDLTDDDRKNLRLFL